MSEKPCNKVYCDICSLLCRKNGTGIAFYMKNCKEHRVVCDACYKIITRDTENVECLCCRNMISEFISLPTIYYDITHDLPFTI